MTSSLLALILFLGVFYLVQWNSLRAQVAPPQVTSSVVLELSQLQLDVDWAEFWENAGFLVAAREHSSSKHVEQAGDQIFTWYQELEEWVLIRANPGANMEDMLQVLVAELLSDGQRIVLERTESGYRLSCLVALPGYEQYIVPKTWHFSQGNPLTLRNVPGGSAPRLAVVIDDWAFDSTAARQLLDFPLPLTIAILPYQPASNKIAVTATERGHDVILHQPMEPLDLTLDPGPGALYLDMDELEIAAQLMANLRHLPLVVGVNNHMGSRATSDTRVMQHVFQVLKSTGLFFLDSYTISTSVAGQVAQEVGVPYAVNDLFIDNVNDEELIMTQIRQGISMAQRKGSAIIIGHVRPRTASALWKILPEIIDSGVQLVPVSALLQIP